MWFDTSLWNPSGILWWKCQLFYTFYVTEFVKKRGYYSNELSYLYGVLILEVPGVSFKAYLRRTGFGLGLPPLKLSGYFHWLHLLPPWQRGPLTGRFLVFLVGSFCPSHSAVTAPSTGLIPTGQALAAFCKGPDLLCVWGVFWKCDKYDFDLSWEFVRSQYLFLTG